MAFFAYPKDHYPTVTATAVGKYKDVFEFMQTVDAWLIEHNIKFSNKGHSTTVVCGIRPYGIPTFTYTFQCYDEKDIIVATLRWA